MKQLIAALAKAKPQFHSLKMSGFNKFSNYYYTTLADIISATTEALSGNGLVYIFTLEEEKLILTLWHESGEFLTSSTTLVVEKTKSRDGKEQSHSHAWGAAITYSKKYLLAAMLGVAADEDDDNDVFVAPASASTPVSVKLLSEEQIARLMAVAPLDSNGEISDKLRIAITAKSGAKTKIRSLAEIPPDKFETILNWLPTVKLE
ncbi:MAG: hypothetical protein B7C55_09265 [Actinomycetales bacterium mxb001]|nr:MAG: hypothetical protein B7C55_09265 [Actinomycetales bacterium mxb001]